MRDQLSRHSCDKTRALASSPGPEQEQSIERAQQAALDQGRDLLARAHAALAHTRQLLTQTREIRQQNHARREYQVEHTDQPAPAASRTAGARRRSAEPDAAGPRHILLVDDDHALRLLLTELLEEEGFQVTPAADGEAALAVLQTTVPDVLLTDYHMPRLDGLGLLRAVHQHWPLLPVVFCMGEAELEGQVRGYDRSPFSTSRWI